MQSKQRNAHSLDEELLVSKSLDRVQDFQEDHPQTLLNNAKKTATISAVDGYKAARIWKWARQETNKNLKFKLSLERITAKRIYFEHQKVFDQLAKIFSENNMSPLEYIRFFAIEWCGSEDKLDGELLDPKTINAFEQFQQANAKKKKIYHWFMKSVDNIAKECVQNGWFTTKDFMRHLINEKKLAGWYASGKISKYYLAAIPNF